MGMTEMNSIFVRRAVAFAAAGAFWFSLTAAVPAQEASKRWSATGGIGVQYDDNVTTDETDNSSNKADKALLLDFGLAYKALDTPALGLEIGYDFSQSLFEDLTDFDLTTNSLSVSAEREIGDYDAGFNYIYTRTLLGGKDFLSTNNLSPTLGYAVNERWYIAARYNYVNKNFITNDPRDAHQNSGTVDNFLFFMQGKAYVSLGYKAEDEDTDGDEFDYFGHFLNANVKMPIPIP